MRNRNRGGNGETAADLEARLRENEAALLTARERVAALEAERARAVDARDEAATDAADRKLMLATRELEAIQRGVERLAEQLAQTREREAVERKHAFVAYVRALAVQGVAKAERRLAVSAELQTITDDLEALVVLIREANTVARELGEARIDAPQSGGVLLSRTPADQLRVARLAKKLRSVAAAA